MSSNVPTINKNNKRSLLPFILLLLAYMSLDNNSYNNNSLNIHCYLIRQKSGRPSAFHISSTVHNQQLQQQQQQKQPTNSVSQATHLSSPVTKTLQQSNTTIVSNSPAPIISQPVIKSTAINNNNKFTNCSARRQFLLTSREAAPTEHVPDCSPDGSYEAMQCMDKMGICWCVDYNGKFIQNTQSEKPDCRNVERHPIEQTADQIIASRQRLFDSRNNRKDNSATESQQQIVPGSSSNNNNSPYEKMESDLEFGMFQFGSHLRESATPITIPSASSSSSTGSASIGSDQSDQTLVLIPGDCATSRSRQLVKSKEFPESRPWVPDCDYSSGGNGQQYRGLQCHVANTSICFCVDTYTGLPLRGITGTPYLDSSSSWGLENNNEMIKPDCDAANKQSRLGITEVASVSESGADSSDKQQQLQQLTTSANQQHISICGGDKIKKQEFLSSMLNSFQEELYNRLRLNDSLSKEFNFSQSRYPTRVQIMKWKFQSMDKNSDNQLDDNEWALFRSLIKLARDRDQQADYKSKIMLEQQRDYRALKLLEDKQTTNYPGSYFVSSVFLKPARIVLLIPQRQCWSEFLDSCENKSQNRQLITMKKWLDCTETNPVRYRPDEASAAQQRRLHKNPFLSILKTD